jgi:hypothetical protein
MAKPICGQDARAMMEEMKNLINEKHEIAMAKIQAIHDALANSKNALIESTEKAISESWAKVAASEPVAGPSSGGIREKKKSNAVLIVHPKENDKREDLVAALDKIDSSTIEIRDIKRISKGGLAITCENEAARDVLLDKINECLPDRASVREPTKMNPRLKIKYVAHAPNDDIVFLNDLMKENKVLSEASVCKLVRREKVYKKGELDKDCINVILEVDGLSYNKIMTARKLKFHWQICTCVDSISVKRCFKCLQFGHLVSNCQNELACANCAGNHKAADCDGRVIKCINCVVMNQKHNLNLSTNHKSFSEKCSVYKKRIEAGKRALKRID